MTVNNYTDIISPLAFQPLWATRLVPVRKTMAFTLLTLFVLCCTQPVWAKQVSSKNAIHQALQNKQPAEADRLLRQKLTAFTQARQPDSLSDYLALAGETEMALANFDKATQRINALLQTILSLKPRPLSVVQAYKSAASYYSEGGWAKPAYDYNLKARESLLKLAPNEKAELASIERNLGECARRLADMALARKHFIAAIALMGTIQQPKPEDLYFSYNAMGTMAYYESNTDSAEHYFTLALSAIDKMPAIPLNRFYRKGLLYNNLVGVYGIQGRPTDGIKAMESCISLMRSFLAIKEPAPQRPSALAMQFEAIDNLAGIYKELGNLSKTRSLLEYSFAQKQAQLPPGSTGIFISQILLGQCYYALREYDKAIDFLNKGREGIRAAGGDYLFWHADACYGLALVYDKAGNRSLALHHYQQADSLYYSSFQGSYDNIYLEFIRNYALFLAESKQPKAAIRQAQRSYGYVLKNENETSMIPFYQLLNLSAIYYECGQFKEAAAMGNKALSEVDRHIRRGHTLMDSVGKEVWKPRALLLRVKASYALLAKKDEATLQQLLSAMQEALDILDRRKRIVSDASDLNLILADHDDLLAFTKQLTLELYELSGKNSYMDQLIDLHESGLYTRLRSRLDKQADLQFHAVPRAVRQKEQQLQDAVQAALSAEKGAGIQQYLSASKALDNYRDQLSKEYPRYYAMRYARLFHSVKQVQQQIPEQTTVVRYFFTANKLLALVADRQQQTIIPLDGSNLEQQLQQLQQQWMDPRRTGEILHQLYNQLWAPLEKSVKNKKLLIIPDGVLYALSFESLCSKKISTFTELAAHSLLAKHPIAYQYSLFLVAPSPPAQLPPANFVAFAPGFSDAAKASYVAAVNDSLQLDNTYLSLLPLPFSYTLARKMVSDFGGEAYTDHLSTEASFKQYAGHHKIIHIGTHAESNNQYPEYSRLIFSKEMPEQGEDNSLFLYELYNCDMRSNLTVLTACESGRPGYQDGEGMVSLAHAFNYAGSESILTALWKIDEQASALITETFYNNLRKGMSKDEALQQAKLAYLATANGRMLAPQYWAGLVIMGDTHPIVLGRTIGWPYWVAALLLLLAAIGYGVMKKRKNEAIVS